jgi:hypothetical protein
MKRAVRVTVRILAAVALSLGLIVGIPIARDAIRMYRHLGRAASREPAAREAWEREFGDPGKTRAAYPKQTKDAAAVRLLDLVRPLGSGMVEQPGRRNVVEPAGDRALSGSFTDYIRSELTRTAGAAQPPPETVAVFLNECRTDVDAIVDFLSVSEPPVWEIDVWLDSDASGPDPLWQMQLQKILVADALDLFRLGKLGAAEEALDASWTLNASLRERPDVLAQMIAVAVARMQVGLVRRISVDPAIWHSRLADHDYRASLFQALDVDSVRTLERLSTGESAGDRASRTDFLDMRRAFLVRLRDSRVSDRPVAAPANSGQQEDRNFTLGAILARMSETNMPPVLERVHRLIFDAELSELVLEARGMRKKLGHWPSILAGAVTSRFEAGRWSYSVDRDNRMAISSSPPPHWENPSGIVLPARYGPE